jgi:hypothetical protein
MQDPDPNLDTTSQRHGSVDPDPEPHQNGSWIRKTDFNNSFILGNIHVGDL